MSLETIKSDIVAYKELIRNTTNKSKEMIIGYKKADPYIVRTHNHRLWVDITKKETELEMGFQQLNECITQLDECKALLNELNENIQTIKQTFNNATTGELGMGELAFDSMIRHGINPEDDDLGAQSAFNDMERRLDEAQKKREQTKRGGRKTKRKRAKYRHRFTQNRK